MSVDGIYVLASLLVLPVGILLFLLSGAAGLLLGGVLLVVLGVFWNAVQKAERRIQDLERRVETLEADREDSIVDDGK
ncbi:hypothetical protein ACFQDG_02245 [Natronoarchaeum mannanilyticum]|uniref:DUF4229 domain-containing protein n=1 Tax=Natronoarchaeum mannanilyticum TaxID=926360 RepID=A0AAV3TBL5_9EURY